MGCYSWRLFSKYNRKVVHQCRAKLRNVRAAHDWKDTDSLYVMGLVIVRVHIQEQSLTAQIALEEHLRGSAILE